MTTLTAPTPLASYQQGRDKILASIMDAVSGLEGVVLDFQHAHEGSARSISFELSEAQRDQARLEGLLGEQARELETARRHVCPALPSTDSFGLDLASPSETVAPAAEVNEDADAAARTIEELRASLQEQSRVNTSLNEDLAAERRVSAGLRDELAGRDARITTLEGKAAEAGAALTAASEAHQKYVRDAEKNFEQRLARGLRGTENSVRAEAVRIVEAIAADNPGLAEAADLFTVAFPAEAAPDGHDAAVPQPALTADAVPASAAALPVSEEDFLDAIPAAGPADDPAPLTQVYMQAPDLSEDAILDPDFFATPPTADAPEGDARVQEEAPAEFPKPSYGLFGRKKEEQNV